MPIAAPQAAIIYTDYQRLADKQDLQIRWRENEFL